MAVIAGERRIVTVLFADIVGSTAIAERLGAERSKLLVDEVMRLMGAEVERYEGTVAQYVGDELYAVFGAPMAHEDDSERAVRAAVAIQRALARYAAEVRDAYGVDLAVRIAINTGPVVIRPESEDPYNALGDTVNVAARIQELVAGGEIVVGRATKTQVDACFELESLGERELRGLTEPVEPFRVLRPLEGAQPPPSWPLVGRDFELTVLERALDGLADGRGVIVSVTGEAGIGKSRLVAEAVGRYGDRVRFLEGRAVSYAASFPYWPIRDLLRDWLGVGTGTPEARTRLELKAELARYLREDADSAYPFLASLLGLALEPDAEARLRELNRESLQRETFEFFAELLCRLAGETSVCLVLDDLQWADDSTLELLEEILAATEEAAVGLLFLYRSEREHGSWRLGERARQRYPHRYRDIELRPLPDDASRALAASVAGADLPEPVAERLAVRAGGNPFFLEEALRDLIERGALRRDDGRLVLAVPEEELAIPALVQGALQARLDRLDPGAREVLSYAAVLGRSFGLPLLELLVPHDQLLPSLSELQRLDLVVEERRRPTPEYRFRHGLVQEVAYAGLVEPKRRKLHLRVGEALEELRAGSLEEVYGPLARHFTEADAPEKAAEYLLKAGDAARALYADQEALEHYRRARAFLARLGDERRARDTLFKIALAHHLAFDFEEAEAAYDEAFCCRVDEEPRPEPTETLETAIWYAPDALAPGHVYSNEGLQLVELLFRGLLTVDGEMNVVPELADNFRVSSDGLVYLFRLRKGARWSDGVPLTAEDFAYAWRRTREDRLATAHLLADVEHARALDDRTLEVRLSEPRSYFPYILSSVFAFPWPRHRCEALGDDWRRPEHLVGNGPFVLRELTDNGIVLAANPYWPGGRGNLREIRIGFLRERETVFEDWQAGRYDVLAVFDRSAVDAPDTVAAIVPQLTIQYVGFRSDRPPFSSELLRKAFSHAIDRNRLTAAFGGLARPATRGGAIPPAMPGHSHRIGPEYDPELARRLLAEAGYPDGQGLPELELAVPTWLGEAEALVEQWAELGVRVRARQRTGKYMDAATDEKADLWVCGWTADHPDPDGFFRGFFEQPETPFYRDEEMEELLERARSLQDQDQRMRLYHELDRLLVRERAAILPLAYSRTMLLRRPWVEGLWFTPLVPMHLDRVVIHRP